MYKPRKFGLKDKCVSPQLVAFNRYSLRKTNAKKYGSGENVEFQSKNFARQEEQNVPETLVFPRLPILGAFD